MADTGMYNLQDLLYLMERLRHPEHGCPWDLKQDYKSIMSHTLEEAYEVADAIERENKQDLKDELGDLLFQVIFYSQLGKEEQAFEFSDVVDNIVQKLVRRHPHVFPNGELRAFFPEGTRFTDEQIKSQWEAIKAEERRLKKANEPETESGTFIPKQHSLLGDIPNSMPALNRAEKLQKRASQHGFDWTEVEDVFAKVEEELQELRHELDIAKGKDLRDPEVHQRLNDEMGDLLFCCVNLSRFLKVRSDEALQSTNEKFLKRFQWIEKTLHERGDKVDDASLEELDALWDQAKAVLEK